MLLFNFIKDGCYLFSVVLEIEPRALSILGKNVLPQNYSPSTPKPIFFVVLVFELGASSLRRSTT
jgi:hypothetical protein